MEGDLTNYGLLVLLRYYDNRPTGREITTSVAQMGGADSLFGIIIILGKGTPCLGCLVPNCTKSGSIGEHARLRSHRAKK